MRKGDKVRVTCGSSVPRTGVILYVDGDGVRVHFEGASYPCDCHISELEIVRGTVSYIVITGLYSHSFHGPFNSEESAKAWADEAGKGAYEIATLNEPVES